MIITENVTRFKSKLATPVARNIFWLFLDKILKLVIGLIVGIWVARYLGPTQWGEINYVSAFLVIVSTIAKLGMDGFLVKEILHDPSRKNEILGTSFFVRLSITPFLLGTVLIYFYLLGSPSQSYWLLIFLSPNLFTTPFDLIDLDFQSRLKSKLTIISKNTAYVLGAVVKIYFIVSNKSLLWFAAAMGLETIISYIFLTIFYQRSDNILLWSFNKNVAIRLLKIGWPFTFSSLAIILYMRIDQVMIGSIAGEKELGLFSSVVKISDIFLFLPMAVSGSYMPSLISAKKIGQELFIKKIQFFMNWMTRVSLLTVLFITLFSSLIIDILYGAQYTAASSILVIHIWSLVPIFLSVATTQYMIVENLQKFSLYRTILGLICNVLLNLYLIPIYGAWGAALATTVSQFFVGMLSVTFFRPTRMLFTMQIKSFLMIFSFDK